MNEDIQKYFRKEIRSFHRNFRRLKRRFNPETVHGLRLNIKRTRALLLFLQSIEPELTDTFPDKKPFKKLFNLAGEIRDTQVQRALLKITTRRYHLSARHYSRYLRELEKQAVKTFADKLFHSDKELGFQQQQAIETLIRNLEDVDQVRIRTIHLLNTKIGEISKLIDISGDDEAIHTIRIILKQILFVFTFTRKFIRKELFLNLSFKKIKSIESVFGDWHDRWNAIRFLEDYMKQDDSQDLETCTKLLRIFSEEKEMLAKQLTMAVRKELNFYYVLEI